MPEDEVLQTTLKTMSSFRTNVGTLGNNNQAAPQIRTEWNNVRTLLNEHAFPKLGPSVRFATRIALSSITTSFQALDVADSIGGQNPSGFRSIWVNNIQSQISELEELIKNPPPDAPVRATAAAPAPEPSDKRADDLTTAKNLLEKGGEDAKTRADDLRWSANAALVIAGVLCIGAVAVPLVWSPTGEGWSLAAQWGTRLLEVCAFLAPALLLIRVSSEHHVRAMTAHRERSLLQVLAASAYMTSSKDHGAALIEFVKNVSQPEKPTEGESSLVLPAAILKELPALLKAFKTGK